MLYNGFLKIDGVSISGKTFEVIKSKDSVVTLLVETKEDPLEDVVTLGTQMRIGPLVREGLNNSVSLCAGYVEEGEPPAMAASREAAEEYGAQGWVNHLGSYYVAPGTTTEVSHLYFMEVRQWTTPTDTTEGIKPLKTTLANLLELVNNKNNTVSCQLAMCVRLYAKDRGLNV